MPVICQYSDLINDLAICRQIIFNPNSVFMSNDEIKTNVIQLGVKELCDITIQIPIDDEHKTIITCQGHRCVLAMRSEYWKTVLLACEPHSVLTLPEGLFGTKQHVETFLGWMYATPYDYEIRGEFNSLDEHVVQYWLRQLHYMGFQEMQSMLEQDMMERVDRALKNDLTPCLPKISVWLELARTYKCEQLQTLIETQILMRAALNSTLPERGTSMQQFLDILGVNASSRMLQCLNEMGLKMRDLKREYKNVSQEFSPKPISCNWSEMDWTWYIVVGASFCTSCIGMEWLISQRFKR